MPIYYRNNSTYGRPLVRRLKTRLSVNFAHGNSQTVYNSKGKHTKKLDMNIRTLHIVVFTFKRTLMCTQISQTLYNGFSRVEYLDTAFPLISP